MFIVYSIREPSGRTGHYWSQILNQELDNWEQRVDQFQRKPESGWMAKFHSKSLFEMITKITKIIGSESHDEPRQTPVFILLLYWLREMCINANGIKLVELVFFFQIVDHIKTIILYAVYLILFITEIWCWRAIKYKFQKCILWTTHLTRLNNYLSHKGFLIREIDLVEDNVSN